MAVPKLTVTDTFLTHTDLTGRTVMPLETGRQVTHRVDQNDTATTQGSAYRKNAYARYCLSHKFS